MKAIKYIIALGMALVTATSCMNNHDEPDFTTPPFGNNSIAEANTTIAELKAKGITTGLAVIIVGEDPASKIYVANKISVYLK